MKKIIAFAMVLVPSIVAAQPITDVNTLTNKATNLGNVFIGLLIAFAVIWIIFSVVMFIVKSGSDDAAKYRTSVLWGIVGLFVILSVWGLVRILTNTFTTDKTAPTADFPKVQYPGQVQ